MPLSLISMETVRSDYLAASPLLASGSGGRHWAPEPDAVGAPGRPQTVTLPRQGGDG